MNRFLGSATALLFLAGCATAPVDRSFNAEQASAARGARVFVIVPQDKVVARVVESNVGQQFGLVGMTIDLLQTSSAYKSMYKHVTPLHVATADVDFRTQYAQGLRASRVFADAAAIEIVRVPPKSDAERAALLASAGGAPTVLLDVQYHFDVNSRVLIVDSRMSMWLAPYRDPAHSVQMTYYSEPVSPDRSWEPMRRLAPLWAAEGGRRYRAAVRESVEASMAMLRVAIMDRPSNLPAAQDREQVFTEYGGDMPRPAKGKVVQGTRDRAIVLTPDGRFYSVSTGPTFASVSSQMKSVPPTHGRVFFYRMPQQDVAFIQPTVYANGTRLGEVSVENVAYVDLRPGKYTINLKYEGDSPGSSVARPLIDKIQPIEVVVQPGMQYYVRFDGYRGVFTRSDSLKLLSAAVAEPEMLAMRVGGWVK